MKQQKAQATKQQKPEVKATAKATPKPISTRVRRHGHYDKLQG